jgi:hypothetical protein
MYSKFEKRAQPVDKVDAEQPKWETCAITREPLGKHIVCDEVGTLFNKESVLQKLLDRTLHENPAYSHIRLRDLIEIHPTDNPAYLQHASVGGETQRVSRFICPISTLEIDFRHKFSALRTCGCVLAETVLAQVNSPTCISCGKPFSPADVIRLNPRDDERDAIVRRLQEKRAAERAEKAEKSEKPKKERKSAARTAATAATSAGAAGSADVAGSAQVAAAAADAGSARVSQSAASTRPPVLTEEARKRKTEADNVERRRPRTSSSLPQDATRQAAAISEARKASSAVYASLFTSSKT